MLFFGQYRKTSSCGKPLQQSIIDQIKHPVYKFLTTKTSTISQLDFMIIRRKMERNHIEEALFKAIFLIKTYIQVIFRYAEHHVNSTYALGYELT